MTQKLLPVKDAQPPFFVGVDLGGTNIKTGMVDDLGRTVYYDHQPTDTSRGPEDGARRMGEGVLKAIEDSGISQDQVLRVGLGSPGTMDVPAGMLLHPHNLPGWFDFPIRERVSHHCGLPVTFANDANAAAYGEFWIGRGADFHSMVLLTLGTGIGCGIIVGDLSIDGEHSHGAECGHIIIDYNDNARMCPCGQVGHLEAYASATAVIKRTEEALEAKPQTSLRARLDAGEELSPLLLAEEAETGDEFSEKIIMETARYLGIGVVNLMHTIDPNGIVLGGAMTFGGNDHPLGRRFLARVNKEVQNRAFPVPAKNTEIDFAELGGDAGYIGAAGLARLAARTQQSDA